jgi:hypothetical protein
MSIELEVFGYAKSKFVRVIYFNHIKIKKLDNIKNFYAEKHWIIL